MMRSTTTWLLAAVLTCLPLAAPTAALADPSVGVPIVQTPRLEARASVADEALTATGRLLRGDGRPLAGRPVSLLLEAQQLAVGTTDAQGRFTIHGEVPQGTRPEDHDVQVTFAGDDELPGVSVVQTLNFGRQLATTVQASVQPAAVKAGGRATVTGQLRDSAGKPVVRGRVVAHDHAGNWIDEMVTDAQGRFTGMLEVMGGSPAGGGELVVEFTGDQAHSPSSQRLGFTIAPGGFTPAPRVTGAPSPSPSPSEGTEADSAPSPTASSATPRPVDQTRPGHSRQFWAMVVLAGLGLVVSLLAMGVGLDDEDDEFGTLIGGSDEPGTR